MAESQGRNRAAAVALALRAVLRRLWARPVSSLILILGIALSSAALLSVIVASRASISAFTEAVSGVDSYELRSWGGEFSPAQVGGWLSTESRRFNLSPFLDTQVLVAGERLTLLGADMATIEGQDLGHTLFVPSALRRSLAESSALRAPVTLEIGDQRVEFSTVQELSSPRVLADSRSLLIDIAALQRILGRSEQVRWLSLSPRSEGGVPAREGLPQGFYLSSAGERRSQAEKLLEAFRLNILVMVAMTLVVAAISVLNTLQLHVLGSGVELSTLRTIGVGRAGVFLIVLSEAAFLGILGGAVGSTLGKPVAQQIAGMFLDTAGALYFSGREIGTDSLLDSPYLTLAGFITAVVVSLAGALLPAWQASKAAPAIGARRPSTVVPVRLSRVGGMLGGSLIVAWAAVAGALRLGSVLLAHLASVALLAATLLAATLLLTALIGVVRVALRSSVAVAPVMGSALVASHRRAAALAAMIASVGCALLLGMGIMVGSFRETLRGWIDYTVQADLFIRVPDDSRGFEAQQLPEQLIPQLQALPEVAKVTSFARVSVPVRNVSVQLSGTQVSWLLERGIYRLLSGSCSADGLSTGAEGLVSEVASRKLALTVGDRISVLGRTILICGIFQDFAAQEGSVLLEEGAFESMVGANPIFSVGVYLKPGVDLGPVQRAVQKLLGAQAVVLDNTGLRQQILTTFDRTFAITELVRLLLFVMTLGGAAIGIAQLIWERADELKTFRLLGASSSEVGAAVIWIGAEIAVSALGAGVLGGVALALLLLTVINPVSFGWSLGFAPQVFDFIPPVLALGLGIPLVAAAAGFGLRRRMYAARQSD